MKSSWNVVSKKMPLQLLCQLLFVALVTCIASPAQAQQAPRPKPPSLPTRPPGEVGVSSAAALRPVHLKDLINEARNAAQILNQIGYDLTHKEHRVSLRVGGEYMVNNCLGIRVITGQFGLRLPPPKGTRTEGSAIVWDFNVDRVSLYGLRVRVRPNPGHLTKPCSFGKALDVGGAASNVRLELRIDPLLDIQQCRLLSIGMVRPKWRIGGLNLKPLQNDLDKAAKVMIEEALTLSSEVALRGPIQTTINRSLQIVGGECKVIAEGNVQ